jgi:acetyl esterase/lipase
MQILLIILAIYTLLWLLWPCGNFIYEGIQLPWWIYRLKRLPTGGMVETKVRYGKHFRQYLLYFKPHEGAPEKRHVVLYFHGGGWQFGSPEMFRPNAKVLTDMGYHVFMPSHRRLPFYRCLALREDAGNAVAKVLQLMKERNLAEKKIILAGNSSGGHLASLLAFDPSLLAAKGLSTERFHAILFLGAPLNLEQMWPSPPLLMVAGRRKGKLFPAANPYGYVPKNETRPILIVHGTKDGLVEYSSVVSFVNKMQENGATNLRFETLVGGVHTDSASWCFQGHVTNRLMMEWLEKLEDSSFS